jgi:hypothetical protein
MNPTQQLAWVSTGNYPAGPEPWSGQPLAVAGGSYLLPGVKWAAENANSTLGQINTDITQLYGNGTTSVASLTAMRALPVPTYNTTLLLTPENCGAQVNTGNASWTYNIGGEYYWDGAYGVVDNGSTCVQPSAVTGINPGRWRLKSAGLILVFDAYVDSTVDNYTATFSTSSTASATLKDSGTNPVGIQLTTGSTASNFYLNDIIECDASITMEINSGSATSGELEVFYYKNGTTTVGATAFFNTVPNTSSNQIITAPLKLKYYVTAADVTAGTLSFTIRATGVATGGTVGFQADVNASSFRIWRQ